MNHKDTITIRDLKVDCIIGILPNERKTPQQLLVDVEIVMDLTQAAATSHISRTLDYALVGRQVRFILETGKFELLESAALAICCWLAAPVPTAHLYYVDSAAVTIRKPAALDGIGIPEVSLRRFSRDIPVVSRKHGDINEDILFTSDRVAVMRLYQFGTEKIPGSSDDYPFYKDMSCGSRDLLRLAWKHEAGS
jgi:dihydroneopterin aldolase